MVNLKNVSLVDANYILHSTYHVSKFRCKEREQFVKDQIKRANSINRYHSNCVFVYDSATGDQTNKDILEGYKGSRGDLDEEVAMIFKATRAIVRAQGYRYACHPKYEADQLIGSYALHLYDENIDVKVIASDKDFNQLVKKRGITIHDPLNNCPRLWGDIVKRYGITPSQFAMYLTLLGDTIDDVPGLAGCGPKTAVKFIQQYGKYSVARKEIFNVKKPNAVERRFQESIKLLDKCFKVVKLGKIEGIERPPEPEPFSKAKLKRICDRFEMRYKYLFEL